MMKYDGNEPLTAGELFNPAKTGKQKAVRGGEAGHVDTHTEHDSYCLLVLW